MFMQVIRDWWNIMNVKTMLKGIRRKLSYCEPVTRRGWETNSQGHRKFLLTFIAWLKEWHGNEESKAHRLSSETYHALLQSTDVTVKLCDYLFLTYPNINFILLGKFQTDNLEGFFGKLRTLSGRNYRITILNVIESIKKCRARHYLTWILRGFFTKQEVFDGAQTQDELEKELESRTQTKSLLDVSDVFDFDFFARIEKEEKLPSLFHLAGVCVSKILRRQGGNICNDCAQHFTSPDLVVNNPYYDQLNRGGDAFFHPSDEAQFVVRTMMGLHLELSKNDSLKFKFFAIGQNQHTILMHLTMISLESSNVELDDSCEECGQNKRDLYKRFLSTCANVLLDNNAKMVNDKHQTNEGNLRVSKYYAKITKLSKTKALTLLSQQQDSFHSSQTEMNPCDDMAEGVDNNAFKEISNQPSTSCRRLATPKNPNLARKLQVFGDCNRY